MSDPCDEGHESLLMAFRNPIVASPPCQPGFGEGAADHFTDKVKHIPWVHAFHVSNPYKKPRNTWPLTLDLGQASDRSL